MFEQFEQFSHRARRVVFLARKNAGRRGAAALEPSHLVEALVREDQGCFENLPGAGMIPGIRPWRPFFSAEAASEILLKLEQVFTKADPIPDSADMPVSSALDHTFTSAMALSEELDQKQVDPLHLLAAVLSEQSTEASEAVKQVGISREAVIRAIGTDD